VRKAPLGLAGIRWVLATVAGLLAALVSGPGLAPVAASGALPPGYARFDVEPGEIAANDTVTVGSIDPCPAPPAETARAVVQVLVNQVQVGGLVPVQHASVQADAAGDWSAPVRIAAAGTYQFNAECGTSADDPNPYSAYGPGPDVVVVTSSDGYYIAGRDAVVASAAFGDAAAVGPDYAVPLPVAPVVGVAADPTTGLGYWQVAADGGVFAWGTAPFEGSAAGVRLAAPMSGMVPTPSGKGYWLLGRDGGIFTFGDAVFYGSGVGENPTSPAVGVARTGVHTAPGLLIAHADGSVWQLTSGSAQPVAAPIKGLAAPMVGIASTPSEMGFYLVGADGGVFTFGDAVFAGSAVPLNPVAPIVGMAVRYDGGYWVLGSDGGIFSFGDAPFEGSYQGTAHAGAGPAVGLAATPDPLAPLR